MFTIKFSGKFAGKLTGKLTGKFVEIYKMNLTVKGLNPDTMEL